MTVQHYLNLKQAFDLYPPEVRKVLKMCLCVLPLVFIDISPDNEEANSLSHIPILHIPVAAANMLWSEILNCENLISAEERTAFLQKCSDVQRNIYKRPYPVTYDKKNGYAIGFFQKRKSNPITTIKNPIFNFITGALVDSSGLINIHVLNKSNMKIDTNVIYSKRKDKWFENNKEFMMWFEKNTSITQSQLFKPTNRLEYFRVNQNIVLDALNLKKHLFIKEAAKENIFELCNEALANACLGRLKINKCITSDAQFSDNDKVWIQRDVSSVYAIRMLPLHYLRSGNHLRCASMLASSSFLRFRIEILGIIEATRQHCLECTEMRYSMKENDPKRCIVNSIRMMKIVLESYKNNTNENLIGKALHCLASHLDNLGMLDEAIEFYQHAIIYKKSTSELKDSLVHILHRMGQLCTIRGYYAKSLTFYAEALSINGSKLESIQILQAIAKICAVKGNYERAIFSYEQIIKLQSQLKVSYLQICTSYNKLGHILEIAEHYEDAKSTYFKALKIMDKNKDEENQLVGTMYYKLGRIYSKNNCFERALKYYAKALNWRRKCSGDNHIEVAKILHAIGKCHLAKDDSSNAISHFELSIAMRKNIIDSNKLEIVYMMFDLAFAYNKRRKFDKAIEMLDEIMKTLEVQLDKNDIRIAFTHYNKGLSYAGKNDHEVAIACFEEALNIQKKNNVTGGGCIENEEDQTNKDEKQKWGANSSNHFLKTSDILKNLGLSCVASGDIFKGIDYFEETIQFLKTECPGSIELADMYQTVGDILMKHNIFGPSSIYYTNAYEIRKNLSSDFHTNEGDYFNCMGVLCLKKEEYESAMPFFQKSLDLRKQSLGERHEKVADTLVNIGQTYKSFLLYEEALRSCNEAILIYEDRLGLYHQKVANLLYNIAIIQANIGSYKHSIRIFEKVLLIYKKLDFDDHQCCSNAIEWIVYLREKVFLGSMRLKPTKSKSVACIRNY